MSIKEMDTLYERSYEELDNMINDILVDSERNDKKYKKLNDANRKLRHQYPNLSMIYESENPKQLNEEELNALITILDNELRMRYMIYEKIFILGNKEAYYYFKRMNLIKEEDK